MTSAQVKKEIKQYGFNVIRGEKFIESFDYPDYYISDKGRVWSQKRHIFLKHRIDGKLDKNGNRTGYDFVSIPSKDGTLKNIHVHKLVALAHIPNPKNHNSIDHINDNKRNNQVDNLQWMSLKENLQKQHCKPMEVINLETGITTRYNSVNEVLTVLDISTALFYKLLKDEIKRHTYQIEMKYV